MDDKIRIQDTTKMSDSLEAWARIALGRPSIEAEALNFYELDSAPSGSATAESFSQAAVTMLHRLDFVLAQLGGRPRGWIPYVQLDIERTSEPLIRLIEGSDAFPDLAKASVGLAKNGQVLYWGSWEVYQRTIPLRDFGLDGYRIIQHSCLNDRNSEFSWDSYRNQIFVVKDATLYEYGDD